MTSVTKWKLKKALNVMLLLKSAGEYKIGRDGSVGIATRYGPDGPEFESRFG